MNGWSNYATWAFFTYMNNTESYSTRANGLAKEFIAKHKTWGRAYSKHEKFAKLLEKEFKNYDESINFTEIAEVVLDAMKEG